MYNPHMKTRNLLSAILFFLFATGVLAQDNSYLDSLKQNVSKAETPADRVKKLAELAYLYMGVDRSESDNYARQLKAIAEESRDRTLMVQAFVFDAMRYSVVGAGIREDNAKASASAQKALEIAKTSGLPDCEAGAYATLAHVARLNGESDKALNYSNLALSLASADSLRVLCLTSLGDTYLLKSERLLAFRNYLQALTVAEELGGYEPLRESYYNLADFYRDLGEYEKSKDYFFKVLALTVKKNKPFDRLNAYRRLGFVYTRAKQYDIAQEYFEKVLSLADSIHFNMFRVNGYLSILEQYLQSNQSDKALAYFNTHADLREFLKRANADHYVYLVYGLVHHQMGRYDSAQYYYTLAEPIFEAKANGSRRYQFYTYQAGLYNDAKKHDKAIIYLQKADRIGETLGDLEMMQSTSNALDTTYQKLGDYKRAYFYNRKYHAYTDSLRALATEKDVMVLEVADEAKRREREELKAEEKQREWHNIQYMGITVAIAAVFIVLVMLGAFRVSKATIKILGFFAFIFLFEFIILIADNQIHHATHGEPWKIMLIKIGLISILLPLHHFLEEKVIHYLTSHRLLETKESLLSKFRGNREERAETEAHS